MKEELLKLQARLDSIDITEINMDDIDKFQNEVLKIESEFEEEYLGRLQHYQDIELNNTDKNGRFISTFYINFEKSFRQSIKVKKGELEMYDPDDMLDMMYPNGDDDFFDET